MTNPTSSTGSTGSTGSAPQSGSISSSIDKIRAAQFLTNFLGGPGKTIDFTKAVNDLVKNWDKISSSFDPHTPGGVSLTNEQKLEMLGKLLKNTQENIGR